MLPFTVFKFIDWPVFSKKIFTKSFILRFLITVNVVKKPAKVHFK